MLLEQFHLESLGHASYLVGSEETGEALVFDPRRDVELYLAAARRRGLRIRYALDSHGHNDYLSGLSELAGRVDLQVLGSAAGDLRYAHRPIGDGDVVELGEVGVEVLHTPGHTPEHVSLLLYDRSAGSAPAVLLSGGALLVGDVARPDLLGGEEEARRAATTFCHTIQRKILSLPDHVEVFPTHVAGSLCGGNIGSRLSTTVGYERLSNEILARVSSSEEFVEECLRLDNLPAVPPYWRRMRSHNLAGVERLGVLGEPPALQPEEVTHLQADGAVVVDARAPEAFGAAHIPGALNVGLGPSFATWAGTVLPEGARVVLVLDRPDDLWEAAWQLLRVGYDPPVGWLAGGMRTWRRSRDIAHLAQITVHELRGRLQRDEVDLLDVRQPAEWAAGHVPEAVFVTGAELPARAHELPDGKPLAVICGSGYRSSVSASLLAARRGLPVLNVLGGMAAWKQAGYPSVG
ncbi:MAG: MBL fold metallo-hydrolase [Actinobacteria bacterium]|nr:MBL fold metallo-hydrolase [Actinomycetota bacterium]